MSWAYWLGVGVLYSRCIGTWRDPATGQVDPDRMLDPKCLMGQWEMQVAHDLVGLIVSDPGA